MTTDSEMTTRFEKTIPVGEAGEAVDLIAAATGLSKSRIKAAMKKGAVWLGTTTRQRRLRRATARVETGDTLTVNYDEAILSLDAPSPTLVADEQSFSVWFKPAGVMSSGSRFGDHTAIDRMVEALLDRPTFLVHRLDRHASGLMVLAHDKKSAALLARQFRQRDVMKTYRAVVEGELLEAATVTAPLDDRDAISHISPIASGESCTLVEVRIETGRKHQIRRHLAQLGHPVLGDRQYGNCHDVPLALTSCEIGFMRPDTGEPVRYALPKAQQPHLPD